MHEWEAFPQHSQKVSEPAFCLSQLWWCMPVGFAEGTIKMLMQSVEQVHLQRVDYGMPIRLLVLTSHFVPTRVFCQSEPIVWVHLPVSPSHVVMPYYELVLLLLWKATKMSIQTFGKFPDKIVLPYDKDQLLHLQQYDDWTLFIIN